MEHVLASRLQMHIKKLKELEEQSLKLCAYDEIAMNDIVRLRIALKLNLENLKTDFSSYLATTNFNEDLVNACIEMQSKAEEVLINVETLFETSTKTKESQPSSMKLPILNLPKFKGDATEFSEFYDRFDSAIGSRDLKDVEKLAYLINCLEGQALDEVKGLSITNENYIIALDMLRHRYGSKTKLIDAHYEALNKLRKASNTAAECRFTLNCIQRHLRVLTSLGENTEGNHIRVLLLGKFPERVLYELNVLKGPDCTPEEVLYGLERIVTAMESAHKPDLKGESRPGSSTEALHIQIAKKKPWSGRTERPYQKFNAGKGTNYERKGNLFDLRKRKSTPTSDNKETGKKTRKSCIFCNGNHYNDRCDEVKSLKERRKKLGKKCFLCFMDGHFSKDCKKDIKCYHCKEKHNSALCTKEHGKIFDTSLKVSDRTYSLNTCSKSFLQTATVKVQIPGRNPKDCRLLLDSGSQRSYVTSDLANKLKLKTDTEDSLIIYTFGSDIPKEIQSPASEIEIETKRGIKKIIRANIVPFITTKLSAPEIPSSVPVDILADDSSAEQKIDLLIGNDYYFSFIRKGKIQLDKNLYLVNTDFGWMPSGFIETNKQEDNVLSVVTFCQCHRPDCPYFTEPDLPLRSIDIRFLWSLEGIGITDSPKASREDESVEYFNKTVKYENGRYQVKWPWVQYPPELPTNYGLAFGRLKGLFKRLDMDTVREYDSIFKEQLKAEIIEEIKKPENPYQQSTPPIHYLPHHMVKQEGKRGRIVYDASAKTKEEKSLNECLYRGPSMLEDLTALLISFRLHKIGITADVEKAFLQIGLQQEDREVTRFLWLRDINKEPTEDNIIHLRFTKVPFGIISSPFLLTASIRHHMSQKDGSLLKEMADRCYVDNLVTGAQTKNEAMELYNRTNDIFEELSMNIREWTSNDKEFLQNIPRHKRAKGENEVKILGLTWNLEKDTLCLKYKENTDNETPKTRKEVLKTLARIYDPCGFVAPLVLSAKILFQELCRRKLKWDENVPEDLLHLWEEITQNLNIIKTIKVSRYLGIEEKNRLKLELHCFTDASKDAYAAVVYLRINDGKQTKTAFVMAKSRVTPLKEKDALKIPKLELLGCLIGCRLVKYVKNSLAIPIEKLFLWTDSLIVLSWMRSNKLLPPFVAKRIDEIKQHKEIQPYYVNTNENPADLATRPDLWLMKKDLWFNGPEFLLQDEINWPVTRSLDYHRSLLIMGEGQDADHPDEQVIGDQHEEMIVDEHHDTGAHGDIEMVMEREEEEDRKSEPMVEIKSLQQKYFTEEMKGKETHLTRNLGLFLDVDGILRCKGRMSNTCWTYDMKHLILLPKDCQFTNALITKTHEKNYHIGTAHTLSLIRQQYWIPQGRAQVRKIILKCPQCQKHTSGPYKLPSPPALPAERVNYSSPYTYTGVDYLGPVFVSTETDKGKRWICLFTCLAVRAVHLEVVQDLTTEECLLALRRFISSRGVPKVIVSDNGTQFKLTSEVLSNSYCIENKITWRFIPQLAPWHGGFYERLVGLVKNCLKRTLEKHMLKDTQLVTMVKEVEAVINTRPLTNVGSELETVLRPSDFLTIGKCLVTEMSESDFSQDVTTTKRNLVEGWRKGQIILEEFKRMFVNQYLLSLRERYNHSHKQPRITSYQVPCIGDIVQIKGESKNRNNWKIGKIIELIKGSDNQCRVAKVKIDDSIFTRSIAHLYPLEIEDDILVAKENEPLCADIPSVRNVTEVEPPVEIQLPENVSCEYLPEILSNEMHNPNTETVESERLPSQNEEEGDQNLPESERENSVTTPEPETTVPQPEYDRVRRGAAVRARERIAEWTRHLVALL